MRDLEGDFTITVDAALWRAQPQIINDYVYACVRYRLAVRTHQPYCITSVLLVPQPGDTAAEIDLHGTYTAMLDAAAEVLSA